MENSWEGRPVFAGGVEENVQVKPSLLPLYGEESRH
jgi:hypothetical protein